MKGKNLAVSDGNDVGGDIGGHITGLGLDDGEGSEGAGAEGVAHLGSTLEETRVEVEDVTGVGLTSRRTAEEERHLTVGNGLFGKIVIKDHSVLAVVTEVLTHGAAGVGGKELKRGGVGGSGGDDDGVADGVGLLEGTDELSDGGALLADTDVAAHKLLLLSLGLLVDDGIDGDSGLASLTITDDKLTLTTANGDKGVDGLETSGHGLVDGLAWDDTGGLYLSTGSELGVDGALAVDGLTETINNAAKELRADGDIDDRAGSLDSVALKDGAIITEDDNTDVGVLKVESHTTETRREDNHLSGLDLVEAVDAGNTVTN